MSDAPRFSIITPVYRPKPQHLQQTIDSVLAQDFPDWELILVDDASKDAAVTEVLRMAELGDKRVKVIEREQNGHIVKASNDGLARAVGQWIVLLDHDDLLTSNALGSLDQAIQDNPEAGFVYSDEDKVDASGKLTDRFEKPDWSPERLRHQMYLGHLSALRHDLVSEVGGFRQGFDGSQDHDLALRVTERCQSVAHVPKVLYHWRMVPGSTAGDEQAKDYATVSGVKAVQEHLTRLGFDDWTAEALEVPHHYRVLRTMDPSLRVSLIIPTRGSAAVIWGQSRVLITEMVTSVLSHTEHLNLEIVIVYDASTPTSVLEDLQVICGPKLVLKRYDRPFNFSEKVNLGVLASTGDIVILMNDDMEVQSERFVENLCAPLRESSVGMTGARLMYSDGRIQHAGVLLTPTYYEHAYVGFLDSEAGFFRDLQLDHETSALTAACVAVRREVFDEVGGFNTALPSNFNDVDFSLKVRSKGYRLVWLAEVRATHFESLTRDNTVTARETQAIEDRWDLPPIDLYTPTESRRVLAAIGPSKDKPAEGRA